MRRIALCLRYDGTAYHGWQSQSGLVTVQTTVEAAICFVANHPVRVFCAGRTDAGVHAVGQVIHFDTVAERTDQAWILGINSRLPFDIRVVFCRTVPADFHARFTAQSRRYAYLIYNDRIRPSILRHAVGWCYRPLDEARMHEAGQYLLGCHDFSTFRGAGCQAKNPVRHVYGLTVERNHRLIIVNIQANGFLLHMVRNIVGALICVGSGDQPVQWVEDILHAMDRRKAGKTFSPRGLYFVEATYPERFGLSDALSEQTGPYFLY